MDSPLRFLLNGRKEQVSGVDPQTTLLAWLRRRGLCGTKESCAEGECGACAVAVVVPAAGGADAARYAACNSCLVLLPEIDGGEVWTVEGVRARDRLHPVQQSLVESGGSQCGYCTPGFVMSLFAHFYARPRPPATAALAGNLCRCTGYRPIRDAAERLPAPDDDDPFAARLRQPAPSPTPLAYAAAGARFDRPRALDEALRLRQAHPAATLLMGGTDLVVDLNQRGTQHRHVIALGTVDALRTCGRRDGDFAIGAGVSWQMLAERFAGRIPLLAEVVPLFASPLIRARATLGGNLMTASPVGDGAPMLLALDAEVELASCTATRRAALRDFFTGYRRTALASDELLTAIHVPDDPPAAARFYKVSKRELDDIASVSAAFAIWTAGGQVTKARFAFGGVAQTPARAIAAEAALVGHRLDAPALARCQQAVHAAFKPISDARASAAYRSAMLDSLLERFWTEVA